MKTYARLYHRLGRGWYGDFRNYADVGGAREALRPEGTPRPTQEQPQAALLFGRRLEELQARRRGQLLAPVPLGPAPQLTAFLDRHAALKAGDARPETIARERRRLEQIAVWWGDPPLDRITMRHLNDLKLQLKGRAAQTVCHYLNAVSSCLQSAVTDGLLPVNIARGMKRPRVVRPEVPALESAQGHALLVAAAALDRDPEYSGTRPLEAIVGTALLTGARRRELFALLVEDVDLVAGVVHVRPNVYYPQRKSRHAVRRLPLWPQLRRILAPIVAARGVGLLFPGHDGRPLRDLRAALERVFAAASVTRPAGKAWHLFRHTYTAMRLQTTDQGAPVSPWTVKAELGHGSLALIEQTYGHLLTVRHRLDRVEYRPALQVVGAGKAAG